MSNLGSRVRLDTWRRGAPVRATMVGYVILAALIPSALSGSWGSAWINLVLCLAAAAWAVVVLVPDLRQRPPVMAVFVAGVIALLFVLVIRDPWFGFYAYAGYTYSILLLAWPGRGSWPASRPRPSRRRRRRRRAWTGPLRSAWPPMRALSPGM